MKFKISYLLLALILFLAFILGARMILAGDFLYLYDQARDMMLVRDVIVNHNLALIGSRSGIGGFFHGPFWTYALIPFFLIGKGNPFFFVGAYVLVAFITIIFGFFFGKKLYNEKIGVLIAFFLAINSSVYGYMSNGQGLNILPLIYLLIYYCLIKFIRGNKKYFIFASFFIGFTLQVETASSLVLVMSLPVIYLASCILFAYSNNSLSIKKFSFKKSIKGNSKIIVFSILSFSLSILSFILFDIRNRFISTSSLINYLTSHGGKEKGYMEFGPRLLSHSENYFNMLTSVVFIQNILLLVLFLSIIILSFYFLYKKRKASLLSEMCLFILIPGITFLFYIFYPYTLYKEYLLSLVVPSVIIFSISIENVWTDKIGKGLTLAFFILTIFFIGKQIIFEYSNQNVFYNSDGSYKNQNEVVDWIIDDAKGKDFGYFVYSPSTFTHTMDYLIWYKGEIFNVHPESIKRENTYLIFYPALSNDLGAHEFWKKNVIRTNSPIILEKKFKGGIIVQKLKIIKPEEAADPNYYQGLIFR